ncbi:MAG: glycosyltransferase involved in cell wall biosynthesis [Alteromonadaceae bacterium]|jgi:glycosyltransferase involved in cell wall biosynthesis
MNTVDKVSYIINTYNRPTGLKLAINSVLKQDFNDIEIIVVDDFSSVNLSEELVSLYGGRIVFIRNPTNLGLARSRQIGLEKTSNEYICFLDDDDVIIDPLKTLKEHEVLGSDESIAVVCSNIIEVRNGIKTLGSIDWPHNKLALKKHFYKRNGIIYPSTTMVRKSSLISVGGFDFDFKRGIDSDVYRRLLIANYNIAFIDAPTIEYLVIADDKITDNKSKKGLENDLSSHIRTIRKYWKAYVFQPSALLYRLKSIMKDVYLLCK